MSSYRYGVLIVDDDPEFRELLELYRSDIDDVADVTFASSKSEALDAVSKYRFHFASVDQRIPDRPGEADLDSNGLELCVELATGSPLTKRAIYTSWARSKFAQFAGTMGGTDYYEKYESQSNEDAVPLDSYFKRVVRESIQSYLPWALERARDVLPPAFGSRCVDLGSRLSELDHSDEASAIVQDRISWLWEQTLWLSWAHACSLAMAAGLRPILATVPPEPKTEYAAATIKLLWEELSPLGWMRPWRKYVTRRPNKGVLDRPGGAFLDAAEALRRFRNVGAHHRRIAISKSDAEAIKVHLLAWVDALAFWADHPLLLGPRVHPSDRRMLQYVRLAGAAPWRPANAVTDASVPGETSRRRHIFALHAGPKGDVLVDLFPLVGLVDHPGHPPEPALLVPHGRTASRISLVDGGQLQVPITAEERAALHSLFGGRWQP